ncbi:hypothetical protein C9I98_06580 [Photobacterium sanctipauli]|uniref:Nuclear transport factor 2 family protein n=2 Tax=Photobacterium sanctipauli TaxID=1342794 RepID=A0A2T3NWB6_9GAMM|nr:hypothetical protein [Photobacterium sanctipauli]PSW20512.1 hypothetical protein C9I98_06580 [Photobacterium sanctipauli]
MYKFLLRLLIATCFIASNPTFAKFENVNDKFEQSLQHCLINEDFKEESLGCFNALLIDSFSFFNGEAATNLSNQLTDILKSWVADKDFYAIHPLLTEKRGSIVERRAYFIEDDSGGLVLLHVTFIKRLSEWSLNSVYLTTKKAEMEQLLGFYF